MDLNSSINNFIINHGSKEKADFDHKIIKTKLKIYGIKNDVLKKKAKEIVNEDLYSLILHDSYEKDFIYGVALAYKQISLKEKLTLLKKYFIEVDNWALVDSVSVSFTCNADDFLLVKKFITSNIRSKYVFLVRFCYMLLYKNYIQEEYIDFILSIIYDDRAYYILMVEAWILSEIYLVNKEKTLNFILKLEKNKNLFKFTKRKLLDSYRVNKDDKIMIKGLK